jgi:Fe2+ or Zn2+ uptake regulation protein
MDIIGNELTPAQEQYLQQVMDNADHLSAEEVGALLEKLNPHAATDTAK